ncbi:non-ribosomal peptide synthase domain TIGR01720/amino acid adenylation domain-containing protein [Tenacibaculum sp. MAR_2009_124]|uniref:non-ribosomal peptide synthetase n=1 Tax=Tenacibaculum sp. MAR_2009_124 TaxID=1250059 RepID=UPI00089913AD|nr:non-ribosomal peptide synthetase [Tenacibaculum sp. MAR_2009_124]SEC23178.1 non-ribosomal peptide synthase domain TIGR01720/amino acid adenylation domain-containing protein [Tenacibaculum sp. MAR_2009_124]
METIADKLVTAKEIKHHLLSELFEEQVYKNPTKVAIHLNDHKISYADLNKKANQIAHFIQYNYLKEYRRKIPKNTVFGVLGKKDINTIASILGILKTGAAYIAISPDDPEERIQYLLKDSEAIFLLLTESNKTKKYPCITLQIEDEKLHEFATYSPDITIEQGTLAQLIYTSGSTGAPKGVMLTHKNLSNRLINPSYVNVTTNDCFLQLANYAFDASTFEIFGALLNGASLVLVNRKLLFDFEALTNYIEKHGVTIAFFTTSFFNAIVDQHIDLLKSIKKIIFGGEAASFSHVKKALAVLGPNRLINGYGPTECTIFTTCYSINEISPEQKSIPIGIPVGDNCVYILDKQLKPVKQGDTGELWVKSLSVAKGYYKKPELTEKAFKKGILGNNDTFYKTGDLGRINNHGAFEFIGRNDNQVKLRGYRIELGEIEYHVMQHPKINFAVAKIKKDHRGLGSIAVWVLAIEKVDAEEIKKYLSMKVSDYMLPRHIIFIDKIPLTSNGKLDKNKLPDPKELQGSSFSKPKSNGTKEEKLLYALKEVLGNQNIHFDDNFFSLGLDSISALHFVTEAKKMNLYFSASDIYNYPTLGELSLITQETLLKKVNTSIEEIGLTPIQQWYFNLDFSDPSYFLQSQTITIKNVAIEKIKSAFQKLVNLHPVFKTKFRKNNNRFIQSYTNTNSDSFFSVHNAKKVKNERRAVREIEKDLEEQIDLTKNELYKVAIIEGKSNTYVLIILHHLIVDGVSWRILLEDLIHLYQGKTVLTTDTKAQWYQHLIVYSQKKKTLEALPFWKSITEQIQTFSLPKDQFIIYPNFTYNSVGDQLSEEKTRLLSEDSFKVYNTNVETLLITAYIKSLAHWIGQNKIVFMLESHGREKCIEDIDVSRTIGWFTSAYPVVVNLPNNNDTGNSIISVKEQLKNVPDNGLSYGALKYLHNDSKVKNTIKDASPEAWFNYLGRFDENQHELPEGWSLFDEGSGHDVVGSKNKHWSPFELNCSIVKNKFLFKVTYDENLFRKETVNKFVHDFKTNLIHIIEHCKSKTKVCYTPSDFELGHLNQTTFETLYEKLRKRASIKTIMPTTGLQRGILFHYLQNKESDQYYVQVKITISGALDSAYLKNKLQELVKENEIFRSVFVWKNLKEPLQCTYEYDEELDAINWNEISLTEKEPNEIDQEINDILDIDRKKEFYLNETPPIRFLLIKQNDGLHTLVWTLHHILIDGWSIYHIINDLVASFENKTTTKGFHQEKSLQFHHLNRWLNNQTQDNAFTFWTKQLSPVQNTTPFPFTKTKHQPSPDKPIQNQKEHCLVFSRNTTSQIKGLAKQYHVTLNSLFQFSWAKMLQLLTNRDVITFGVTVSGRNHNFQGIERIVGPLINTLPVVTQWANQHTIKEQVRIIHKTFQQINEYSYIDLNELLKMTQLTTPHLFNHILVFENHKKVGTYQNSSSDIHIENVEEIEKTNYPITVLGSEEKDCLQVKVIYDTDCFEEKMIHKMLKTLKGVLEYTLDNPMAQTNQIETMSANLDLETSELKNLNNNVAQKPIQNYEGKTNRTAKHKQRSSIYLALWEKVLDQEGITLSDDFFHLGGHSLNALEISNELKQQGELVSVNDIYQYRTIENLLSFTSNQVNTKGKTTSSAIQNDKKLFPLSPLQQRFVKRKLINRNRFNVPFLAKIKFKTSIEAINNVVKKLVEKHKSLQLRFVKERNGFKQYYDNYPKDNLCDYFDLSLIQPENQDLYITKKCEEAQTQFNLLEGKLFKVIVFNHYIHPDSKVVFFLFHHLVFDGVSLQIFTNDFFRFLTLKSNDKQTIENQSINSCSYKDWVLTIQNYIVNKSFSTEHTYWKNVLRSGGDIPTDLNLEKRVTHREMNALEFILIEDDQLMNEFTKSIKKIKLMPSNFLISVFYNTCNEYFKTTDLLIDIMSQQRESFFQQVNIQNTTGFFAGAYPVRLSLDKNLSNESLIQQINKTVLEVPKNGLDYFILKYSTLGNNTKELLLPEHRATCLFHYLKTEHIFPETANYEQLNIPFGFTNSKDNESNYLLNLTIKESAQQLSIRCYYSTLHFKETTITDLMNGFKKKMHHLLNWNYNH